MTRLATARDNIFNQSNRFLVAGMVFAALYAVKAVGLRIDLVVLDTKIFDIPYGLFVFCILGAGSFLIAQSRYIDAHALDRRLSELAKSAYPEKFVDYLCTFPADASWLRPAREQFFRNTKVGEQRPAWIVNLAGLSLLALYLSPTIACIHFLFNWPSLAGNAMVNFQWWSVLAAASLDLLFLILVARIYKA